MEDINKCRLRKRKVRTIERCLRIKSDFNHFEFNLSVLKVWPFNIFFSIFWLLALFNYHHSWITRIRFSSITTISGLLSSLGSSSHSLPSDLPVYPTKGNAKISMLDTATTRIRTSIFVSGEMRYFAVTGNSIIITSEDGTENVEPIAPAIE